MYRKVCNYTVNDDESCEMFADETRLADISVSFG